jgi:lipid A ethanolaminephosphotransferase
MRFKLTATQLIVLSAVFLLISGNATFFENVLTVYPWSGGNAFFLVSLTIVTCCAIVLLICLLSILIPVRVVLSFLFLVAAFTAYVSDSFGTIVDATMINNIFETDVAESTDLTSIGMVFRVIMLGIVPAVIIWFLPLRSSGWWVTLSNRSLLMVGSMVFSILVIVPLGGQYASFVREHKAFRYYSNPSYPLYSLYRFASKYAAQGETGKLTVITGHVEIEHEPGAHDLVIMVVGETARRDRFSLNGYQKNTNPLLAQEPGVFSYSDVHSCGTSTAISVPCMFAMSGRKKFDSEKDGNTENALDVLYRAGVSVLWRDNNSSSKGVADRVHFEDFRSPDINPVCDVECRDVGMLHGLQDYINAQSGDILIVLHQMGNHGPAYFKRYPEAFEKFKPACQTAELSECSDEEISNAYDNAILYTDYFLSQVVQLLKQNEPEFETSMLYISDHGESLGENNLYLHGMPYMLAPPEQTEIPVIVWAGETSDIDVESLLIQQNVKTSQDAVFWSLLTLFDVRADWISSPNTLFQMAQDD